MIHSQKDRQKGLHGLLLLCWLVIGIGLRFTNLGEPSPSSIEISTLGFSLGNGFLGIPLDKVISLDTLLSPLQFNPTHNFRDVIDTLMSESTHPPLSFVLTHWWLKLFSPQEEVNSLWIARSLNAILGAVSIPAIFALGTLAFRSR
ncbi:MAG: glycosyltransferase family 39 protein, partial [Microcystaceae cyanobacterium]